MTSPTDIYPKDDAQCFSCRNAALNPVAAFISLGSNLENPTAQVTRAFASLASSEVIKNFRPSSLYRSVAVGPQQPDFINAVAGFHTTCCAYHLLDFVQSIENQHKRIRGQHWGPRTLDIDILLYGEQRINSERLVVPHTFIKERNFVIIPLLEIEPSLTLPDGVSVKALAKTLGDSDLTKLNPL